jgi:tetratricopeptide (TPR) repeat protein
MPRLYDPNPLFTGLKSVEEDIRDWEQTCEGFVKAGDRPSLAQAVSDKAMRIPEEERDVFLEGLAQLYWSEYCQGISDGADPGRMTYRLAMAEEALTLLHKLFPDNAGYYRLRSEIAFEKNETKKSLDYAEEGISVLRPKLPKAGLRLADQLKPVGNDGQMEVVPLNFSAAGQKETAFQSARYISVYSMYRLVLLKAQALERLGRAQARKEALEGFRNTLRGIGLAQTVMAQRVEELLSK